MFKIPMGNKEKKETNISVRVRATVLERLKEMADRNSVSQSKIIEALVDQAYEQMDKTNIKKSKKKSSK
ncbi:MAG: ribbon-helix-helix protein, CopG family [Bacteriovoracaceae bacterium]|nr:ribbon-helix-helix protein, CopG family [Bacteriovoracaceae bacterium]